MTRAGDEWTCTDCGDVQGRHDMYHDGICGSCQDTKTLTKMKDEVETILINKWSYIGMEIPDNYEDIVQYCYEDILETADPKDWNDSDVAIAFRRWIEEQTTK